MRHAYLVVMRDILKAALEGNQDVIFLLEICDRFPDALLSPFYNKKLYRSILKKQGDPAAASTSDSSRKIAQLLEDSIFYVRIGEYPKHIENARALSPDKEVQFGLAIALGSGAVELWTNKPVVLPSDCPIKGITTAGLISRICSWARQSRRPDSATIATLIRSAHVSGIQTYDQFFELFEAFERTTYDSLISKYEDGGYEFHSGWMDLYAPYDKHQQMIPIARKYTEVRQAARCGIPDFIRIRCIRFRPSNDNIGSEERLILINVDLSNVFVFPQDEFELILNPATSYRVCLFSGSRGRVIKITALLFLELLEHRKYSPEKQQELYTVLEHCITTSYEEKLDFFISLKYIPEVFHELIQRNGKLLHTDNISQKGILEDWTFDDGWRRDYIDPSYALVWRDFCREKPRMLLDKQVNRSSGIS